MKRLADYITITQALDAMGAPRNQNMRYYRVIYKAGIKPLRIGHQILIPVTAFAEAAGLPPFAGSWPTELAELPVHRLMSRQQAASELGVSISHLYNLVRQGKIRIARLWPWGGDILFIKENNHDKNQG